MAFIFDDNSWRAIRRVLENMAMYQQQLDSIASVTKQLDTVSTVATAIPSTMMRDLQAYQGVLDHLFNLKGFGAYLEQLQSDLEREPDVREVIDHPESDLILPETRERIITISPSLALLEKLRTAQVSLDDLPWRRFEEVVAELLSQGGYEVRLGPGSKDGGKDIIAIKYLPGCGLFMAVWQAKKLQPGNKVGINVIRELADTRNEHRASKGVIVTTTSLTRGALARIEQDRYLLSKVDGADLLAWVRTGQAPGGCT